MARRLLVLLCLALGLVLAVPGAALACGGLIAPGHAEVLRRATTLAAWYGGDEHYVTGFQFAGNARSFGYIVPLPGVPSRIEKGGDWTLERLQLEVNPVTLALTDAVAFARAVEVVQRVRVEALDITVVRGGGPDVAAWARRHGFDLTPDTEEVLGAYSSQGSVFALARFDALEAARRGLLEGQGTVIHFTIPTPAPWIPLRILALGKGGTEVVNADLFVLTPHRPSFAPELDGLLGMSVLRTAPADPGLLRDLRSDRGMGWLPPEGMWLTAMRLEAPAATLTYDLSIDGGGPPLAVPEAVPEAPAPGPWVLGGLAGTALLFVGTVVGLGRRRPRAA